MKKLTIEIRDEIYYEILKNGLEIAGDSFDSSVPSDVVKWTIMMKLQDFEKSTSMEDYEKDKKAVKHAISMFRGINKMLHARKMAGEKNVDQIVPLVAKYADYYESEMEDLEYPLIQIKMFKDWILQV